MPEHPVATATARFSQLSPPERLARLRADGTLTDDDLELLRRSSLAFWASTLEKGIENLVSAFPVPLGVAPGFIVNGVERPVLMATEERSVIAGAAHAAKLARPDGFKATAAEHNRTRVQILFSRVTEASTIYNTILSFLPTMKDNISEMCDRLRKHGGGVISAPMPKTIMDKDRGLMVAVTFTVDTVEAMGAMVVTEIGENVAEMLRPIAKKRRTAVVVTNDSPGKETTVEAHWRVNDIGAEVAERMLDIQTWGDRDPVRAVTHNKGIMNGVSAVCLASGQDVRAVESAVHAQAAKAVYKPHSTSLMDMEAINSFRRDGTASSAYHPLTAYRLDDKHLVGTLKLQLPIGTVGGATAHPLAVIARRIMKAEKVADLACVIGAVGLAQNFAALRMLADEGLIEAHLRLKK